MNEIETSGGPSRRGVEAGVALATVAFGLLAAFGSLLVGIGWGVEGPKSGFFPFYIGCVVIVAGLINLLAARRHPKGQLFAAWPQLRLVLAVVVPTAVYVAAIPWLGLYVCSIVLIAAFMVFQGKYRPIFAIALSAGIVVVTFATFEWWFLVPLPKGPIEELLGL
ncbi:MAG: tripartite tricarboxylate transporter TctB family protein [Acetobacteraceae bacterium]|nr:tripartite tricarboxylate transporter TctB family protein [Acetobacteraceae bacterium]